MPLPKRDAAVYYNLTSNRGHYLVLADGHVREPIGEAKTVDNQRLLEPQAFGTRRMSRRLLRVSGTFTSG